MIEKRKMLITGVSGLLGNNLAYYFRNSYAILGLYNSHPIIIEGIDARHCDLTDSDSIKGAIAEHEPEILIHCAALTDVDRCEEDRDVAEETNVAATRNIVSGVGERNVYLIYISTDAVYEGTTGDYSEDDEISPQNYYGRSKYEGELEISKYRHSLILRTCIFGWNIQDKKSLGEWILEELTAGRRITGFRDVYFSPIYTMELARVIDISIKRNLVGVYNCGSMDSCSKYEFAIKIAERFGLDRALIKPISIDEFNFRAKRGKNLALNVNKIKRVLNYKLPTINHSVEAFYRSYKCGLPDTMGFQLKDTKFVGS